MLKRIVPVLGFIALVGMLVPQASEACDLFKRLRAKRAECRPTYTYSQPRYCAPANVQAYYIRSGCYVHGPYYRQVQPQKPVLEAPQAPSAPEAGVPLQGLPGRTQPSEGPELRDFPGRDQYRGLPLRNVPARN